MIQQALRKLFRTAPDRAAQARQQQAAQPLEMQLNEWLARKEQARVHSIEAAIKAAGGTHTLMLECLQGIDPDDLAEVTRGRVTCPVEHREMLRTMLAAPMPLESGIVPWRLAGDLATAVRVVQRPRPHLPPLPEDGAWPLAARLLLIFLGQAARHVEAAGWRWRIVQTAAGDQALARARASDLVRLALESPRLGLAFAPPDAHELDAARRITETEIGLQRFSNARVQTRALLARLSASPRQ